MKITEFKTGLFGYKKEGVYRYIATLNERYSETLNTATRQNESKIEELTAQNAALQEEVAALRAALRECKNGCMAMIEAVSAVCGEEPDVHSISFAEPETKQEAESGIKQVAEPGIKQVAEPEAGQTAEPSDCEEEPAEQTIDTATEASAETNLSVFRRKNKA